MSDSKFCDSRTSIEVVSASFTQIMNMKKQVDDLELKSSQDTGYAQFAAKIKSINLALGSVQAKCRQILETDETYHAWKTEYLRVNPGHGSFLLNGPLVREFNDRNGL